jgi:acyl-coenzyme A synthetase/AMP-(fatty) acid ligase
VRCVVRKLASVLEAAAVGVPVGGKGERVKVYIVLKEGESAFPRQPATRLSRTRKMNHKPTLKEVLMPVLSRVEGLIDAS